MATGSLSVIIATKDRFDELFDCVRSVSQQSLLPSEVIIVDDSDLSFREEKQIRETVPASVQVHFTESDGPAGLSVARNTGAREASGDIIVYLDDDAEIGETYLNQVQNWFDSINDSDFVGVGGFDNRLRTKTKVEKLVRRLFLLPTTWEINRLGMQGWDAGVNSAVRSNWMEGNNFSYKRSVLINHPFPQYNGGREALEDIAVGWELKKEGKYSIIDPDLEIKHYEAPDKETAFITGKKEGMNRVRYFRTYGQKIYLPLFYWATIGQSVMQLAYGLCSQENRHHIKKGLGIIYGLVTQLLSAPDEPIY